MVQLAAHAKSSALYGRTSNFFRLDGLLQLCIIMGLRLQAPLWCSSEIFACILVVRFDYFIFLFQLAKHLDHLALINPKLHGLKDTLSLRL